MKDLIERLRDIAETGALNFHPRMHKDEAVGFISEAADLIQSQQSRIKELEGALDKMHSVVVQTGHRAGTLAANNIARTTLGDKAPIHPVKTRGTE